MSHYQLLHLLTSAWGIAFVMTFSPAERRCWAGIITTMHLIFLYNAKP